MKLIIPLAGDDDRFETYKPFVLTQNQPLISLIMSQHDVSFYSTITYIIRSDQEKKYNITQKLQDLFSFPFQVRILEKNTLGAPCTILEAMKDELRTDEPLIIELADVLRDLKPFYHQLTENNPAVSLLPVQSFTSFPDRPWGYVELESTTSVSQLKEKIILNTPAHATMGLYHFANSNEWVTAAKQMIDKKSFVYKDTYFVGPIYNELIGWGREVRTCEVNIKTLLGSPADL